MLIPDSSQDDKPLVLLLSEPNLPLSKLVEGFLHDNSIAVESILLDKSFFEVAKYFLNQKRMIYKIVLLYGFEDIVSDFYREVFTFIREVQEQQTEQTPLVLLSGFNSSLKTIGLANSKYESFTDNQKVFLESFFSDFSKSQVFLAQDMLLDNQKINYPLLCCFSAIKQNNLLDFNNNFYFQDELSFFELIKIKLIKPHTSERFLIKGKPLKSSLLSKKISYLYEQYFQKKLAILNFFSEEQSPSYLTEFTVVKNSKKQIDLLIDKKIRLLPYLSESSQEQQLSDRELRLASIASKKLINDRSESKAQIPKQNPFVSNFLSFFKKPQKTASPIVQEQISDEELTGKIENIFSTRRSEEKEDRQKKNLEQGKEIVKKTKKRRWLFWLGLFIFVLGATFLSLITLFSFSQKQIQKQLLDSIRNGEIYNENIDKSILYYIFNLQYENYQKFLLEESLTHAADVVRLKESLANLRSANQAYFKSRFDLYRKTLEGGVELEEIYNQNIQLLNQRIEAEVAYNAYLTDLNLDLYEEEERLVWEEELEENKKTLAEISQTKRFLEPFKNLVLSEERINVMVLIQDSNEIRSSGGFLTEAIILSFERGKLVDKKVVSIDELSSQVYGQREAPEEIRRFLGEESYFLQDSNWSADFAEVSNEVSWFIEQAIGQKISLFVAVNSKTVVELFDGLEGFKTNDGLDVNKNNYLELLRSKALLDYRSQGDLRFSRQTVSALLEKLLNLRLEQFAKTTGLVLKNLNQREVLLFSSNDDLQAAIESNSWGGKKVEVICPLEFKQENCLSDSLFQLESNLSLNKVSSLITRDINHDVGITGSFIRHRRKITFENLSTNNLWPFGEYRALLKFYLNSSVQIEKIEINGSSPHEDGYFLKEGGVFDELGVLILVPQKSKTELIITYILENKTSGDFSYVFFDQKQAGIFDKKTSYKIVFDENLSPQLVSPSTNYQNKTFSYERNNQDHFLFAISFSRASSENK